MHIYRSRSKFDASYNLNENSFFSIILQIYERKFEIPSEKQFKRPNNWFEIVKVRDNGVRDNVPFLA